MPNIIERAAESILQSDRRKGPEFGGGRYDHLASVSIAGGEDEPATATVTAHDGRTASAIVMPHNVFRPKERAMAAADVHDAVAEAMKSAAAELAPPVH